jgi:hypothetical protein
VCVRAGEAAEIPAVTFADARDEESHLRRCRSAAASAAATATARAATLILRPAPGAPCALILRTASSTCRLLSVGRLRGRRVASGRRRLLRLSEGHHCREHRTGHAGNDTTHVPHLILLIPASVARLIRRGLRPTRIHSHRHPHVTVRERARNDHDT